MKRTKFIRATAFFESHKDPRKESFLVTKDFDVEDLDGVNQWHFDQVEATPPGFDIRVASVGCFG